MHFVLLDVRPQPRHPNAADLGGASAACWVASDDPVVAESRAALLLEAAGWDIVGVEELRPVVRDDFLGAPERLALFDQALVDGTVVTLHTWPVDAPDADDGLGAAT